MRIIAVFNICLKDVSNHFSQLLIALSLRLNIKQDETPYRSGQSEFFN